MEIANGVWPVMITPFTLKNEIDYDGVLQILEWYKKHDVTGVFAVCQSSEMFELSKAERLSLAKFVVKNAPKGMGVVASGHVANDPDEQIAEAQAIIDTGVQSYVFISNHFAAPDESEDDAKRHIEYLINNLEAESFGIYECPYPYKRLVSPALLAWCAQTGKFSFLKDTCCDLAGLAAKCEAVRGTGLKVFNANSATLLQSLKLGCAGYSGVMANFHADLYAWLVQNYKKEPERAQTMMDFLGSASMTECQLYPVNSKYHMQLEGLSITTRSRKQDDALLTGSRMLEIEELHDITETFRKNFFAIK